MPVPRGPINSRGLFRLQHVSLLLENFSFQILPYRQVDQVLIACRVNSWYKKVMVVVEVVNLCVFDYVIPVFPLAPCLEVKDKLEYQSLNQPRSGLQERTFNPQTTSMGGSASNLPFRDFGRGQSDLFPNITCMPCILHNIPYIYFGTIDIIAKEDDLANALVKLGSLSLIREATAKAPYASIHHPRLIQIVKRKGLKEKPGSIHGGIFSPSSLGEPLAATLGTGRGFLGPS